MREEEERWSNGAGEDAHLPGSVLMLHQVTQASTQPVFPSKYHLSLCSIHLLSVLIPKPLCLHCYSLTFEMCLS